MKTINNFVQLWTSREGIIILGISALIFLAALSISVAIIFMFLDPGAADSASWGYAD